MFRRSKVSSFIAVHYIIEILIEKSFTVLGHDLEHCVESKSIKKKREFDYYV